MEETGYTPVAHFILPEYCWLDCFYKPMQENIPLFLEKYKNRQMRKFMDYYLPTALKLLKTYAELDAQGVEGENIRESKPVSYTHLDVYKRQD